jgi:hypothetical protein
VVIQTTDHLHTRMLGGFLYTLCHGGGAAVFCLVEQRLERLSELSPLHLPVLADEQPLNESL